MCSVFYLFSLIYKDYAKKYFFQQFASFCAFIPLFGHLKSFFGTFIPFLYPVNTPYLI